MKLCRTIKMMVALDLYCADATLCAASNWRRNRNSSTLSGGYSLTLSGRDLDSAVFSNILQGTGTATFDGQSKVTFNLTNNTNKTPGQSQTWSGTFTSCRRTVQARVEPHHWRDSELYFGVVEQRHRLLHHWPGRNLFLPSG